MSDATCKTCPWWEQAVEMLGQAKFYAEHNKGDCRRNTPIPSPEDSTSWWPATCAEDWCGDHPDRQPHLECASTTFMDKTHLAESDMRRIIDALEKIASRAARAKS